MGVTSDSGGLDAAFAAIDDEIAELAEAREGCAKAILVSRAAILAGGLTLALSLWIVALRGPMIFIAALTAMIAGTVWAGASRTSGEELDVRRAEAEARKAALFDEVARHNGWLQ